MAYCEYLWPEGGSAGFGRVRRGICRAALRLVCVIEPDGLADRRDRIKCFQPSIAIVGRQICAEGPLREANDDPTGRRLIPVQIAMRRKSMARQVRVALQRRKDA